MNKVAMHKPCISQTSPKRSVKTSQRETLSYNYQKYKYSERAGSKGIRASQGGDFQDANFLLQESSESGIKGVKGENRGSVVK